MNEENYKPNKLLTKDGFDRYNKLLKEYYPPIIRGENGDAVMEGNESLGIGGLVLGQKNQIGKWKPVLTSETESNIQVTSLGAGWELNNDCTAISLYGSRGDDQIQWFVEYLKKNQKQVKGFQLSFSNVDDTSSFIYSIDSMEIQSNNDCVIKFRNKIHQLAENTSGDQPFMTMMAMTYSQEEDLKNNIVSGEKNNILNGSNNVLSGKDNIIESGDNNIILGEKNIIKSSFNNIISGIGHNIQNCKDSLIIGQYAKVEDIENALIIGQGSSSNFANILTIKKDNNICLFDSSLNAIKIKPTLSVEQMRCTSSLESKYTRIYGDLIVDNAQLNISVASNAITINSSVATKNTVDFRNQVKFTSSIATENMNILKIHQGAQGNQCGLMIGTSMTSLDGRWQPNGIYCEGNIKCKGNIECEGNIMTKAKPLIPKAQIEGKEQQYFNLLNYYNIDDFVPGGIYLLEMSVRSNADGSNYCASIIFYMTWSNFVYEPSAPFIPSSAADDAIIGQTIDEFCRLRMGDNGVVGKYMVLQTSFSANCYMQNFSLFRII